MLSDNNIVEICDFGLSKDCYKYDEYVNKSDGPLPVKWMAVESIRYRIYTTKSDVWSFGIFMWELFSFGENPYPGMSVDESFIEKLCTGYRMSKPEHCPGSLFDDIITKCWDPVPSKRPQFSELVDGLGNFLENSVRENYIQLNQRYANCPPFVNHDYLAMSWS